MRHRSPFTYAFFESVYDVDIMLIWPTDHATLTSFLGRRFPQYDWSEIVEDPDEFAGITTHAGRQFIIALSRFNNSIKDLAVLSHETNHCAMMTLFRAGIAVTEDNQEPLAYLQESLFRRCLTAIRQSRGR